MQIINRKAKFDYFFIEKFSAGISLLGSEVKSIKELKVNLVDSFCYISKGEMWIKSLEISIRPGSFQHDPKRDKKLLLKKKEIQKIQSSSDKGTTIIPIRIYQNEKGKIKVEIALAKGKKNWDKREAIKERDLSREMKKYD